MSIDFTNAKAITIPEGSVKKIVRKSDGVVLWEKSSFPQKDTLENTSWADISAVCKAGKASEYWAVGDQKTIRVNGVNYLVDIIGFDHDVPTDTSAYGRPKAGITFQLHDLLSTDYSMNSSDTNNGGWKNSRMRKSTMVTLLRQLSSDLSAVIVPVNKYSGVGGGLSTGTELTSDNLFLLANIEVFGTVDYAFKDEGTQYAYYQNGGSKIKNRDGSAYYWWLRSPCSGFPDRFCFVYDFGDASNAPASVDFFGVSFGFCV